MVEGGQGYSKVALQDLSSRLRRSLREIVELGVGLQPTSNSTISLKASPLAGQHEQKDTF
jgi:hypothetical protein